MEIISGFDRGLIYFDNFESLLSLKTEELQLFSIQDLQNFTAKQNSPKTLLCHDHRGGYLDYESWRGSPICAETNQANQGIPFYSFFHWWHIDVFVYFSHHFITVPPPSWTNSAHSHGVLMLGTFIIENEELCQHTFGDQERIEDLLRLMVDLCKIYKFDGWLINIESKVNVDHLANLEYFLTQLTSRMHLNVHEDSQVIWYDSIISEGSLKWQDALNENNWRWFGMVDGFYTNYCWNEQEHIQKTLTTLFKCFPEKSLYDIYVGIDVFGRGCLGGGGWNCAQPLEIVRRYSLSAAIFAPGWICEKFPSGQQSMLCQNAFSFWNSVAQHVFPHCISSRSLCTDFALGFASEKSDWREENSQNHFCLGNAALQPFYLCSAAFSKDLLPGLIVTGAGIHDLFLCRIPIRESDRKIEISFRSSAMIRPVIVISDGKRSLHMCQSDAPFEESREIQFPIDGKNGWTVTKIALWNQTTAAVVRVFGFAMKIV